MDKTRTMLLTTLGVAIAGFMVLSQNARADDAMLDIDPKFRAKIVKEKAKQAAQQSANAKKAGNPDANCGSQSIGNVNTGGRIGAAPREVFVFAPNAINLVSGNGCN
jgi:hypothetical protein